MGSSDPLPPGFEIRFESLNFQATGNDYLMRLTNREELRAWRQAVRPGRRLTRRHDTNTCQHGCYGSFGATAPPTLRPALATGAVGAPTWCARRFATRRAHRWGDSRPGGGALSLRTALPHWSARHYNDVRRLRQHRRSSARGLPWLPRPGRQDPSASAGDESSQGSVDELPPAISHRYAEWDFSGVPDLVMLRRFLDATDY
jgi:hypothetical protein